MKSNLSNAALGRVSVEKSPPGPGSSAEAQKLERKRLRKAAKKAAKTASQMTIGFNNNNNSLVASEKIVADYVDNLLKCEQGFLIPRPVSTFVAPHLFKFKHNISLTEGMGNRKLILIRPDPDAMVFESGDIQDVAFDATIFNQQVDFAFNTVDSRISMDETLVIPGTVVKSSTATGTGNHFSSNSRKVVPGMKYYSGTWSFEAGKHLQFRIKNPNVSAVTGNVLAGYVNNSGAAVQSIIEAFNAPAEGMIDVNLTTDPGWAAFEAAALVNKGIWFGLVFDNVGIRINSGFEFGLQGTAIVGGAPVAFSITRNQTLQFTSYSLWDLLGVNSIVARDQYQRAARTCVTGLHALLQNTTQLLIKGGNLYAARLPGNTFDELPGDFDGIVALVSSQVHHSLNGAKLENGMSWSYTPEKVQDWLFEEKYAADPYNGNPLNLPYLVLALQTSQLAPGQENTFVLNCSVMLEYLTTDVSNFFCLSPSSITLFNALASELASRNVLSENETHLEKIKEVALAVAKSPETRIVLQGLLRAGVNVATLLSMKLAASFL